MEPNPTPANPAPSSSNGERYLSFLVRIWREPQSLVWRASTEDTHSGERQHFADLGLLFRYLAEKAGHTWKA